MAYPPERRRAVLEQARTAKREKLIREIEPDGRLADTDPDELGRRVAAAISAQYADMGRRKHTGDRVRKDALEAATIAAEAVLRAGTRVGVA
ncbi:hypothetical protein [Micromonospora ureilytica]|uniref:hypothetical protein n=1 Tax=Micromonospora ureilytica TaxID=709868 RepID=UPI00403A3E9B